MSTGRPADEDGSRDSRLSVRCRAAQRAAWVEAAAIRGVELSSVARDLLDAWAERTLTAEPADPAHSTD